MSVNSYADPFAFSAFATPLLESAEAVNNLPLGILAGLTRHPQRAAAALMLGAEAGEARLVAMQTPPFHLVIGQTPGAVELIPELVAQLAERQAVVPGLVAPLELAQAFADAWRQHGCTSQVEMEERLYVLERVIPPRWPAGAYRPGRIGDLGTLLSYLQGFLAEALPQERHDAEALRQQTLRQIEAGDFGLWEVGDQIVSMACRVRQTRTGTAISLVYTPAAYRGRGYAGACVARLSQAQLDAGRQFCCLFTDLANPASNLLYQRIGYRPLADVLMLKCTAAADD